MGGASPQALQAILNALQQNGVNGLLASAQPAAQAAAPFQAGPFWGRRHEGCRRGLTGILGQGIFGAPWGQNPFFNPQNGPFQQQPQQQQQQFGQGPLNFGPNTPQFVPASAQFNPNSAPFPINPQPSNTFGPPATAPISNVPITGSAISPISPIIPVQ